MSSIEIKTFTELSPEALTAILTLENVLFSPPYPEGRIREKFEGQKHSLIQLAYFEGQLAGFKAGFADNDGNFYSFIGGVHPDFRRKGIALKLMDDQHQWLKSQGFKTVTTKTKNKFRSMLLLNIQYGFNITGTYEGSDGDIRILLTKELS